MDYDNARLQHNALPTGHIVLNGSGSGIKRRLSSFPRPDNDDDSKKCKKCSQRSSMRRAGPFLLGPRLGNSPVRSIVQCLARREGTDDFYSIKLLTLEDPGKETQDGRQGKMLLHTEYSLLSLLHEQNGVVHHHGMFQDAILDDNGQEAPRTKDGEPTLFATTKRIRRRLCLVLDCLCAHVYGNSTADLINLQHYVIREKKLSERESVVIFHDIVKVVDSLHQKNIVHRDLKLGNIVLNRRTKKITVTNFCLGKHLIRENDLLKDQRGSPAYISPDVLSGAPYSGKASDMWALGVVLYTMLYGQFPFYDSVPHELFRKIKAADFKIPNDGRVTDETANLIRNLLVLNPCKRITAGNVLIKLERTMNMWFCSAALSSEVQVVPEFRADETKEEAPEKCDRSSKNTECLEAKLERLHKAVLQRGNSPPVFCTAVIPQPVQRHPVIRRVSHDARPLTSAEVLEHRNLFTI
eukprot:gene540-1192_t